MLRVLFGSFAIATETVRVIRSFLLEANVSRLRGHSSASGANPVPNEVDCLDRFETQLIDRGLATRAGLHQLRAEMTQELLDASRRVRDEPQPPPGAEKEYIFAETNLVEEA